MSRLEFGLPHFPHKEALGKFRDRAINTVTTNFLNRGKRFFEGVEGFYEFAFDPRDRKKFLDLVNTEGYQPVLLANHTTHVDGTPLSLLARSLLTEVPRIDGFYLPIAASMASGHQGKMLREMYQSSYQYHKEHGMEMVPVIRQKDREKYGMEGSNDDANELLLNSYENHKGIILLPEASVEGGRKDARGERIGMQAADRGTTALIARLAKKSGGALVFLPVGIVDNYNIIDVSLGRPPLGAIVDASSAYVFRKKVSVRSHVEVGAPFVLSDVPKDIASKPTSLIDFCMRRIAELVPPNLQGIYRSPIL